MSTDNRSTAVYDGSVLRVTDHTGLVVSTLPCKRLTVASPVKRQASRYFGLKSEEKQAMGRTAATTGRRR